MTPLNFKVLSPRELDRHRGICPLEIGRFTVKKWKKEELHGPLIISRIFSNSDIGNSILIAPMQWIVWVYEVPVYEWSDGLLYTLKDSVYLSITRILENTK